MPTPKITEYTAAAAPEKTSVVFQLEFVVPTDEAANVEQELDDFLDNHVNTVGRAELLHRQTVAHGINRAMQILGNRKGKK